MPHHHGDPVPDREAQQILQHPEAVVLPGNRPYVQHFHEAGGRVIRRASGHLVFYGSHGWRVLLTDPDGHPLHECEWGRSQDGQPRLLAARIRLDWGPWVGLKPEGLVNHTSFDLSTRPDWTTLTRDDLRRMAARAMNAPLDTVRFFYTDEDLQIDSSGLATIRQRKDAFYVLPEGRFEGAKFMSCMSRMHWERIDYLPVVELFLSLLPGTGSATFELIRELYDDQQEAGGPTPLHYRGIPVYPSESAFHLFSQFFRASLADGGNPLTAFLDPSRSEEVCWLPNADPPVRFFDPSQNLCVTVKRGILQKATMSDDPAGLSFFAPGPEGTAPFGRFATIEDSTLVLDDGLRRSTFPVSASWGIAPQSPGTTPAPLTGPRWPALFPEGLPPIEPYQAFSATLLYPEDDALIGEAESQPLVLDYVDDLLEEAHSLREQLTAAREIFICGCEAGLGPCLRLDRPRQYTILYRWGPFAQKQAQALWTRLWRANQLDRVPSIRFLSLVTHRADFWSPSSYDAVYLWVPFDQYDNRKGVVASLAPLVRAVRHQGLVFLFGPPLLFDIGSGLGLEILVQESAATLPTFRLHQAILPRARVNPDLMVFIGRRSTMT